MLPPLLAKVSHVKKPIQDEMALRQRQIQKVAFSLKKLEPSYVEFREETDELVWQIENHKTKQSILQETLAAMEQERGKIESKIGGVHTLKSLFKKTGDLLLK